MKEDYRWHCVQCTFFNQCDHCHNHFPHDHSMFPILPSSGQFQNPSEQNQRIATAETFKTVMFRRSTGRITGTDLHKSCYGDNVVDEKISLLITENNRILEHVFGCTGCDNTICSHFRNALWHSFTCCKDCMLFECI